MKLVPLKEVIKSLESLKDRYEELRLNLADEVNDNEIEKATKLLDELKIVKSAIEQMESLKVQI